MRPGRIKLPIPPYKRGSGVTRGRQYVERIGARYSIFGITRAPGRPALLLIQRKDNKYYATMHWGDGRENHFAIERELVILHPELGLKPQLFYCNVLSD